MLKLCGTYTGTTSEDVQPRNGGDPFTSHTIHVRTGEGRTYYVQAARDFPHNQLPAEGIAVELLVWPRPYVAKDKDKLGCAFTAYALAPALAHA